jgi:hypothetical protein
VEQLSNAMHAATADLPPTGIDLDRIIADDRRRHHVRLRVGAVAGVAALGAVTMMVPAVLAGNHGGRTGAAGPKGSCPVMALPSRLPWPTPIDSALAQPVEPNPPFVSASARSSEGPTAPGSPDGSTVPGSPDGSTVSGSPDGTDPSAIAGPPVVDTSPTDVPQPAENCSIASARLTVALTQMLRHDLPGQPISVDGGRKLAFLRFPNGSGYTATADIGSGAAVWRLNVTITPDLPNAMTCADDLAKGSNCTTDPDGTVVTANTSKAFDGTTTLAVGALALVQHPDGTRVSLFLSRMHTSSAAPTPSSEDPLTPGQLADIGRALTLFP